MYSRFLFFLDRIDNRHLKFTHVSGGVDV